MLAVVEPVAVSDGLDDVGAVDDATDDRGGKAGLMSDLVNRPDVLRLFGFGSWQPDTK